MRIDSIKMLMALFALAGLVALPTQTQAAEKTGTSADGDRPVVIMSWEAPDTRVNGDKMPADEIDAYLLSCSPDDSIWYGDSVEIPASESTNGYEIKKEALFPEYGGYACHMIVRDTDGLKSSPSDSVDVAWSKPKPSKPGRVQNLIISVGG